MLKFIQFCNFKELQENSAFSKIAAQAFEAGDRYCYKKKLGKRRTNKRNRIKQKQAIPQATTESASDQNDESRNIKEDKRKIK